MKAGFPIQLAAAAAMGLGNMLAFASPVRDGPVAASLFADVESIRPNNRFSLAIKLDVDAPWHAYWINPGDSGLPPDVAWSAPEGFSIGPMLAPPPTAFPDPPFTTYGHSGEVVYLFDVSAPADLASSSVVFSAAVDWMVCNDVCIPGHAALSLELPVSSAPGQVVLPRSDLFESARRVLPLVDPSWSIAAQWTGNHLTLSAFQSHGSVPAVVSAYFFPSQPGVVDHSAPQPFLVRENGFSIELAPSFSPGNAPNRLKGVLAMEMEGSKRHLLVDVRVPSSDSSDQFKTERNLP